MKIFTNFEQRSMEWHAVRAGVVTASEIDCLVSPSWKIRDSKGVDSYLATKVAERWIGGQLPSYQSEAMERGIELEEAGRRAFERTIKKKAKQVAFCLSDDGHTGCSPDGLIGKDSGLELKCPSIDTHVGYLLAGEVPPEYRAQVQFSMFVTGRASWWFVSYQPGFPMLKVLCTRDDAAFTAFGQALALFIPRLNESYKKLVEQNGREPDKNKFRQMLVETDLSTGTINPDEL